MRGMARVSGRETGKPLAVGSCMRRWHALRRPLTRLGLVGVHLQDSWTSLAR